MRTLKAGICLLQREFQTDSKSYRKYDDHLYALESCFSPESGRVYIAQGNGDLKYKSKDQATIKMNVQMSVGPWEMSH